MAYKVIRSLVHNDADSSGYTVEATVMADSADDIAAVGTAFYPGSLLMIADPFSVKILNASHVWKPIE